MSWLTYIAALLGVSTYTKAPPQALSSGDVDAIRAANGGQLQPLPSTQTRWYLADVETAERLADGGNLAMAAQLMRSARKDGVLAGVLSTRTDGLVRLPKVFRGNPEIIAALEVGHTATRSVFEEMFPASELALLAADGVLLGVGVGELVDVEGRDYPVFVRLDPQFLTYRWNENRWYFRSVAGLLPITPGDGRWILHTPGGRLAPWQNGLWRCIAQAFVRKEHAQSYKDNWEAKLANAARVAVSPQAASEQQKQSWFRKVMAWGSNTVFGLTPGYDVRLLESNGRGHESFDKTVDTQNREMIVAVAGQTVTTEGGSGFVNAGIYQAIRSDLIQSTADAVAYTINTQGITVFIVRRYGEAALYEEAAVYSYDVTPPTDRVREANTFMTIANALPIMSAALSAHGLKLDVERIAQAFHVPLVRSELDEAANGRPLRLVKAEAA